MPPAERIDVDETADPFRVLAEDELAEPNFQVFWAKHSPRFEMPIGYLASAAGILVAACLLWLFLVNPPKDDKNGSVPLQVVAGGQDDTGLGSKGGGDVENPIERGATKPTKEDMQNVLPDLAQLPVIQDHIQKQFNIDDPNGTTQMPDSKAPGYAALSESLRNKMLGLGQSKGNGGGSGEGDQTGAGPGGVGADSSRARSMRWVMTFSTRGGRDYLNQLAALGAVVVVPVPPDNKSAYVFKDLVNPKVGNVVSEEEWTKLAGQVQFMDYKRDSVKEVCDALGMTVQAKAFWAFFPAGLEKELARKEVAYQGRRSQDIKETTFMVSVRGGGYEVVVVDQQMKK